MTTRSMIVALCLALVSGVGCDDDPRMPDGGAARVVPVVARAVERRDVPIYLDGLGSVIAFLTITLHTQVDGQLQEVLFREGQHVKRDELLAIVDPRPFAAQLRQATGALARDRALYDDSRLNLARYQRLRERHLVAQENVDDQHALVGQYRGAMEIDRGQIATAKLNLSYARIRSPIDGVTGIRLVDPGNLVHAADTNGIVVITQLDPIAILFTLPQDDLPYVSQELARGPLTVELFSRDGKLPLGQGKVTVIDNQINQTTATLRLKAIAPNPERRLWPNQFVKAHLLLTVRRDATVVPSTAVQRGPQGSFAYVIGEDERVTARPVETELTQGELTIIKRGLTPGERVVIEGQNQLSPGARVSLRPPESADGGEAP